MSYKYIIAYFVYLIFGYFSDAISSIDTLLNTFYSDIKGYSIDKTDTSNITKTGGDPTYGEITPQAVAILIQNLKLTKDDVFYDLGSGVGKMVVQIYLTTPVKKSVGIELSSIRSKQAQQVKSKLEKANKLIAGKELIFLEEDILKSSLDDATVIYVASLCFSNDFMKKLVHKLSKLKKNLKLITLSSLPILEGFKLEKKYALPMSWSTSTEVYLYILK